MSDDEEPINSHMIIVTLVPNEARVGQACPNCHLPFKAGDQIFESWAGEVAIHVTCVVALALVATLREPTQSEEAVRYRATREQLLEEARRRG